MPFATTNVRTGAVGFLKCTVGDWTGSIGDADGTFVVAGGRVYLAIFMPGGATTPAQWIIPSYTPPTGTTATSSLTIPNRSAVTTGSFIVLHA